MSYSDHDFNIYLFLKINTLNIAEKSISILLGNHIND